MSVHSMMLIFPTIMLVLKNEFSTGLTTLGMIVSLSTFVYGLGALPTGFLERKYGATTLLLIYQIGTIISTFFIANSQSLPTLTIGLIFSGLFASIYHPAGLTLISRHSKKLSKGMAIHGIGGSLGLALGPMIGAGCTELISWRFAYITISIVNLLLFIITLISSRYLRDTPYTNPPEDKIKSKTNKPALKYYYAVSILMGFTFTGFTTFLPTHFASETQTILQGFSDTMRGGMFTTLVLLSGIVGQSMGGWAGARFPLTKYLFWVVLFNIPFLVLLGLVSNYWLISSALLLGIVHFNWQPVANSLIACLTHSRHRGLGYGINFFLNFGIGAGAAAIGGYIAEKFAVMYIFPMLGIVLFPALILSWILIGKVEEI